MLCKLPLVLYSSQRRKNNFCSKSCAATFNNKNKTHGIRRSKLEAWLESQLTSLFPELEIHFNQKDAVGSELDIYIPSLKLAFELNGIFHYEPIYGSDKLAQIQGNDNRKFQDCIEQGISLCVIDTSSQKYFKSKTSQKYLDTIKSKIDNVSFLIPKWIGMQQLLRASELTQLSSGCVIWTRDLLGMNQSR